MAAASAYLQQESQKSSEFSAVIREGPCFQAVVPARPAVPEVCGVFGPLPLALLDHDDGGDGGANYWPPEEEDGDGEGETVRRRQWSGLSPALDPAQSTGPGPGPGEACPGPGAACPFLRRCFRQLQPRRDQWLARLRRHSCPLPTNPSNPNPNPNLPEAARGYGAVEALFRRRDLLDPGTAFPVDGLLLVPRLDLAQWFLCLLHDRSR